MLKIAFIVLVALPLLCALNNPFGPVDTMGAAALGAAWMVGGFRLMKRVGGHARYKEHRTYGGEMMKFREMSLWYKLSIVAAALVGGVVTRYAALVIMAGGHF